MIVIETVVKVPEGLDVQVDPEIEVNSNVPEEKSATKSKAFTPVPESVPHSKESVEVRKCFSKAISGLKLQHESEK